MLGGCLVHREHQWSPRPEAAPPAVSAPVSLIVLGDAGAPGRRASAVAEGLKTTLDAERAAGRTPVVLWTGNLLLDRRGRVDCAAATDVWGRPGVGELGEVVRTHQAAGGASYALPGEAAYRCGARAQLRDGGHPWSQPGVHYAIDVLPTGSTALATQCSEGACTPLVPHDDALAQLVFADITPWIAGRRPADQDLDLKGLAALIEMLAATPGPPRILVSHYPVEAAGFHGVGGGDPDSTVHTMAPAVVAAVQRGVFVGALSGHDRATYASADITDGTIRSDRVFLPHAMFQVVSGAASTPDARGRSGWRRLRYNSSMALQADRYTPRAGFAVVRLDGTHAEAELHAHRSGRWRTTNVALDLQPPARGALAKTPSVAPCLRCTRVPVSER